MYWLAYDLFCLWNNVSQLLLRLDKPPSMGRTRDIVFWSTSLTINISMLWVLRNLAFGCRRRRLRRRLASALKELWRMSRLFVLALAFASYVAFFYNVFGLDQPLFGALRGAGHQHHQRDGFATLVHDRRPGNATSPVTFSSSPPIRLCSRS